MNLRMGVSVGRGWKGEEFDLMLLWKYAVLFNVSLRETLVEKKVVFW